MQVITCIINQSYTVLKSKCCSETGHDVKISVIATVSIILLASVNFGIFSTYISGQFGFFLSNLLFESSVFVKRDLYFV